MSKPTTLAALEAGLAEVLAAPAEAGHVELVTCRPAAGTRRVLASARFDPVTGVEGDSWATRFCRHTPDGSPHPGQQVALMNARMIRLVAGAPEHWAPAGDQLFVDFDLRPTNAPPGTRLAVGEAVLEVSELPHRPCVKFRERYGDAAFRFLRSPRGLELSLRGVNATIVGAGVVRPGDEIRKLDEVQ